MKANGRIERLIIHHSASPLTTMISDIREWHIARGWDDIGYHFVINQYGILSHGRDVIHQGAHTRGFNEGSIGLCVTGDNTIPGRGWVPSQVTALHQFVRSVKTIWPTIEIGGHQDYVATLCPGLDVRKLLFGPNARTLYERRENEGDLEVSQTLTT